MRVASSDSRRPSGAAPLALNPRGPPDDQYDDMKDGVVITRRARIVARLVPPRPAVDPEQARNAAAAIRAMSKGVTLGGLKIKDLVAEGRLRASFSTRR
jgi:antitoxin (DNA-binding transcriptional repressor) of toxin-antitoxin stability system